MSEWLNVEEAKALRTALDEAIEAAEWSDAQTKIEVSRAEVATRLTYFPQND